MDVNVGCDRRGGGIRIESAMRVRTNIRLILVQCYCISGQELAVIYLCLAKIILVYVSTGNINRFKMFCSAKAYGLLFDLLS